MSVLNLLLIIAIAVILTLWAKQCRDPQLPPADVRSVVDSFRVIEQRSNARIENMNVVIREQDSAIADLRRRKDATRTVYKNRVQVVRETVAAAPAECDTLKKQVEALLDVSSEYEHLYDSTVTAYQAQVENKDSLLVLRTRLYSELRASFDQSVVAYHKLSADLVRYKRKVKRDRWLLVAGTVLVSSAILLK